MAETGCDLHYNLFNKYIHFYLEFPTIVLKCQRDHNWASTVCSANLMIKWHILYNQNTKQNKHKLYQDLIKSDHMHQAQARMRSHTYSLFKNCINAENFNSCSCLTNVGCLRRVH